MFWQKIHSPLTPMQDYAWGSITHMLAGPHSIRLQSITSLKQLLTTCLYVSVNSTLHSPASWVFTFVKAHSNLWSHKLTPVGASIYAHLKAGNVRLCLPLHPLLSCPQSEQCSSKHRKQVERPKRLPPSIRPETYLLNIYAFSLQTNFFCNKKLLWCKLLTPHKGNRLQQHFRSC